MGRRKIRVVEVNQRGPMEYLPTGREVQIDADCPLFELEQWQGGRAMGIVMVDPSVFEQIREIVQSSYEPAAGPGFPKGPGG
jgi:hypothetical protein